MNAKRVAGAVGGALVLTVTLTGGAVDAPDGTWGGCRGLGQTAMTMGGMTAQSMAMRGMPSMAVGSEAEYLAEMIPHHQEAVAAARELARSDRPEMRRLGRSIVRAQTAEIAQMKDWLHAWYPGTEPVDDYVPMMRDLSGLEGDALDHAFLQDMTMHHMMAVMMSQQLLGRDLATHDAVEDFAAQVREDQRAEIVMMRAWLRDWFGSGSMMGGPGMGNGTGDRTGGRMRGPTRAGD